MAEGQRCAVVRAGAGYTGRQGLDYAEGISAQSVGSTGLCMHLLTMPPGAAAQPHLHEEHESAVYVLRGRAEMRFGDGLGERLEAGPGDFVYIPAGVPHRPANLSATEPLLAALARTDPNEQESVVLLDDRGRRAA
jgi:uncharacterized RmlC-like cupin family protein